MKRDTKIIAAFVAGIAAMILLASSSFSWAVAHGASPRWRILFRMLCHGIERRCLILFGVPMPICARCTAIYIGLIAGVAAFFIAPTIRERTMRTMMFVATVPIALDGISQALLVRESTNPLRLMTGFIAAFAFGMWALTAVERPEIRAVNRP